MSYSVLLKFYFSIHDIKDAILYSTNDHEEFAGQNFSPYICKKIKGMTLYHQKKLVQVVLYILNETGGIDFYHLFKILYFAERKHLAKWGHRIIADDFYALEYGPVPTCLYDAIKGVNAQGTILADLLKDYVKFAKADAPYVLLPKAKTNMAYISKFEKASLDVSIKNNGQLSFNQLKEKSHDFAWKNAYKKVCNKILATDMAKVEKANYATIEYIAEQEALKNSNSDNSNLENEDEFSFAIVSKEELERRRAPSYSYLL